MKVAAIYGANASGKSNLYLAKDIWMKNNLKLGLPENGNFTQYAAMAPESLLPYLVYKFHFPAASFSCSKISRNKIIFPQMGQRLGIGFLFFIIRHHKPADTVPVFLIQPAVILYDPFLVRTDGKIMLYLLRLRFLISQHKQIISGNLIKPAQLNQVINGRIADIPLIIGQNFIADMGGFGYIRLF